MLQSNILRFFALAATLTFTIAGPVPDPAAEELTVDEIIDVDGGDLAERGPASCKNKGKIKRVKPEYKGACNPANSKGFRSSHNCATKASGKSYLCVQNDKATCYNNLKGLNFENGECFL